LAIRTIINQSGPMPINVHFESPTNAPASIYIAGSVWTGKTNTKIGIAIILDGKQIGAAQIFSNGNTTHRAVVPAIIPVQLSLGPHTLSLKAENGDTTSDVNDFFIATLMY
jgi:hypothetical protein